MMRQRGRELRIGASRMTRVGGGVIEGRELPLSFDCLCVDAPRLCTLARGVVVVAAAAVTCDMSSWMCVKKE
jgi:hypothetical protein